MEVSFSVQDNIKNVSVQNITCCVPVLSFCFTFDYNVVRIDNIRKHFRVPCSKHSLKSVMFFFGLSNYRHLDFRRFSSFEQCGSRPAIVENLQKVNPTLNILLALPPDLDPQRTYLFTVARQFLFSRCFHQNCQPRRAFSRSRKSALQDGSRIREPCLVWCLIFYSSQKYSFQEDSRIEWRQKMLRNYHRRKLNFCLLRLFIFSKLLGITMESCFSSTSSQTVRRVAH